MKKLKSELFNPNIQFKIDLTHHNDIFLNDKFIIYDLKKIILLIGHAHLKEI